jgi:hypothetical protein
MIHNGVELCENTPYNSIHARPCLPSLDFENSPILSLSYYLSYKSTKKMEHGPPSYVGICALARIIAWKLHKSFSIAYVVIFDKHWNLDTTQLERSTRMNYNIEGAPYLRIWCVRWPRPLPHPQQLPLAIQPSLIFRKRFDLLFRFPFTQWQQQLHQSNLYLQPQSLLSEPV